MGKGEKITIFPKWTYPLVNIQNAIENGTVEIVELPINSMVDLSRVMLTFTRGYTYNSYIYIPYHTPIILLDYTYPIIPPIQ